MNSNAFSKGLNAPDSDNKVDGIDYDPRIVRNIILSGYKTFEGTKVAEFILPLVGDKKELKDGSVALSSVGRKVVFHHLVVNLVGGGIWLLQLILSVLFLIIVIAQNGLHVDAWAVFLLASSAAFCVILPVMCSSTRGSGLPFLRFYGASDIHMGKKRYAELLRINNSLRLKMKDAIPGLVYDIRHIDQFDPFSQYGHQQIAILIELVDHRVPTSRSADRFSSFMDEKAAYLFGDDDRVNISSFGASLLFSLLAGSFVLLVTWATTMVIQVMGNANSIAGNSAAIFVQLSDFIRLALHL